MNERAEVNKPAFDMTSIQNRIVARQFDDALDELGAALGENPDNMDALYMSAVCHRYKRNFDAALDFLGRLKALAPENGRAHQEEGHAYRDMGSSELALLAYARACRYNPALVASWKGQLDILSRKGRKQEAAQIAASLKSMQALPPPLLAVIDLVAQGRLLKAEDLCRQFLQKIPHHTEGMRLLAEIGARLGVLDDAEFLLESALKIEPGNVGVHIDYIQILRKRQRFAQALEQARQLLGTNPQNPQFQSLFAIESMQTGDYYTALEAFDKILEQLPADPVTHTSKGHAYKTLGQYEDAVAAYHNAIRHAPNHGEAYYSLANLKVYTFADDEIVQMQEQDSGHNLSHMDRVYLQFALGKAHEDRSEYERAFHYYASGNALKKSLGTYDADTMSADLKAQQDVCTQDLFERRNGTGHDSADPIFIVGLPRAGSTLLEQILSSHSQVDGTLELPNILSLSQRLRRRGREGENSPYPQILCELGDGELAAFGEQYIEDTRIHRKVAPRFLDKMPNNFRHIGLIHLILPNAKIIDARRHPMSCCFSGFKQLFAEGQEFTYDLADMGRYYCDYVELMDHWDTALPGKVLRVDYEKVVNDTEDEVRRLLQFCELPFEDACIRFYETRRSVRTPSSEQVRQPIYTSGLEQWRHFEPWLDDLKSALAPVLRGYPIPENQRSAGS